MQAIRRFSGPVAPPAGPSAAPLRLLLVEEYADARETLAELLRTLGYAVETAASAAAARRAVRPPDVLLVSTELPDAEAGELVRELRARPGWEGVAAIALCLDDEGPEAQDDAFAWVLMKPVPIRELEAAIHAAARDTVGAR